MSKVEPYKLCKCQQEKLEKLKNDSLPWYCSFCENELLFSKMSNNDLKNFLHAENPIFHKIREMMKCFCQINQVFDDNENAISCDYYNIDELNKLNINRHHDLFILHFNISSFSSYNDDLKIFLSLLTAKVDMLCISESRLSLDNPVTTNLDIPGYTLEHTPTEIKIPNKHSSLLGTIYKHPTMKPYKFNNEFLKSLLSKIQAEGKVTFLAGYFNFSLIKHNQNKGTAEFLEHLFSNNFTPHITLHEINFNITNTNR